MTAPPTPPNPPHVDDSVLSDLVDGIPTPAGAAAHVERCTTCSARVAELRRVSAAVGSPVPPAPLDVIEGALDAALGEWDRAFPKKAGASAGRAAGAAAGGDSDVRVVADPARRRGVAPWLGAAAAIVAVLLAAPLLIGRQAGVDRSDELAGPNEPEASTSGGTAGGGSTATAARLHLGAHDDMPALVREVDAVLGSALIQPPDNARTARSGVPESGDMTAYDATAGGAEPDAPTAAPAPTLPPVDRCADEVRRADAALGELLLAAFVTWKGAPAVVLAYALAEPGDVSQERDRRELVVVEQESCESLARQRF